jgi:hypothetical protein
VEAVIAVGVLAVAIPIVFGTLAESGKSGLAAQAETRSAWIVPVCMDEIRASRVGRSQYFPPTLTGQTFPSAGEVWALAFTPDGKAIGKLTQSSYDAGVSLMDEKKVGYIAIMSASEVNSPPESKPMLRVDIILEYPAARNALKRKKLNFNTRIP